LAEFFRKWIEGGMMKTISLFVLFFMACVSVSSAQESGVSAEIRQEFSSVNTNWDQTKSWTFYGINHNPQNQVLVLDASSTRFGVNFRKDIHGSIPEWNFRDPATHEIQSTSPSMLWHRGETSQLELTGYWRPTRSLRILGGYTRWELHSDFTSAFLNVPLQNVLSDRRYSGLVAGAGYDLVFPKWTMELTGSISPWLNREDQYTRGFGVQLVRETPHVTDATGFHVGAGGSIRVKGPLSVTGEYRYRQLITPNGNFAIGIAPFPIQERLWSHSVGFGLRLSPKR
jgi:opacity protein-like surface antigen